MQLTRFTDYCLRVLMYLTHKQELVTIAELAECYRISDNHLKKVVHHLAQLGYIETVRGKGGGMRLGRDPAAINVAEIIESSEETASVIECLDSGYSGQCPLLPHCELKKALRGAQKAFLAHLAEFSLQDLMANRRMQQTLQTVHIVDPKHRGD